MKELVKTTKQTLKVTGKNIWFGIGTTIFAAIVGVIITLVILYTDGTGEDYAHLGAAMALLVSGLLVFVNGFGTFPADFNMALSMGKTRRYLVVANYFGWMKNMLVILLIVLVTSLMEDALYLSLYPGAVCEINVKAVLCNPIIFLTILICAPSVILFIGAIALRFGQNFLWIFWAVYMLGILASAGIKKDPDGLLAKLGSGFAEWITTAKGLPIICILIGAVLLGLAHMMLRKQKVTF